MRDAQASPTHESVYNVDVVRIERSFRGGSQRKRAPALAATEPIASVPHGPIPARASRGWGKWIQPCALAA